MRFTLIASALLAIVGSLACTSHTEAAGPRAYTLVFLKTGPKNGKLGEAENRAAFDGHFSNMARLANEHKLVVAGPYGDKRHDETLHGLFVINSAKRAEATEWAGTDPATRAGVFVLEYHDLATAAPLVAMLDSVLARDAKAVAEGRKPKPGDGARSYVLLTTDKFDAAERELTPLLKGGGVFMLAKIDGSSAFALLDAKDVDEAQQKFAAVLDRIEGCKLDDWFATDMLAHMSEM
jgi:uncharacterized protein YciI